MRWSTKPYKNWRRRTGFLWFPKTIDKQTRWLERATWIELDFNKPNYFGWKPVHWENL